MGSDDLQGRLVLGGEQGGALSLAVLTWALTLGLPERWFWVQAWPCLSLAVWSVQIIPRLWQPSPALGGSSTCLGRVRWEVAACANEERKFGSVEQCGQIGNSRPTVGQAGVASLGLPGEATLGPARGHRERGAAAIVYLWVFLCPQMCSIFSAED